MRDLLGHLRERRQIVDVLEALADGLEDDREARVLARHIQQLRRLLALLPERRALARVVLRQQQGARGALAEPRGEQRRAADLAGDDVVELRRLEDEQLGPGRLRLGVRDADDDAVVGRHRAAVDPVALADARLHGQRPRRMQLHAERGMQHDAPVAELVAEPFHHERPVGGHVPGRRALLLQEGEQVAGGPGVEARFDAAQFRIGLGGGAHLADERSDRAAELRGPAETVALPEREPPGLAERRRHQHAVVRDLLDAPARRPQREHVADPRLVDHLLVELSDAAGLLAHHVDAEHPAIRDGAAARDREALRSRATGDGARVAVPEDARAQFRELVGRIAPGEQVERGVVRASRQGRERCAAPHGVEPVVGVDRVEGGCGDRLLRQDVERVGGHAQRLDEPGDHPFAGDRRVDEVGPVLGEHDAPRHLAHLVPGPADALQSARDRRRGLDLHHEVDRAHVDPELEARGGDHAAQASGLEVVFDEGALLLADGAVVGAREHERVRVVGDGRAGAAGLAGCSDQLRRRAAVGPPGRSRHAGQWRRIHAVAQDALLVDLVEPGGEALGQAPGVREDDGGAMLQDPVDDRLFDVRPDRAGLRRRPVVVAARERRGPELAHVFDRHDDPQIEPLARRGSDDLDRRAPPEEAGDLLRRADGGGQADALRGRRQHRIQPFEREREVRAALGGGDGVHLVDDHGLDRGEGLACGRGEHQEQRLGRGDEDVGRRRDEGAPLVGGRVARADAHAHVRRLRAETLRRLGDPDERSAQVALDVDAEGFERGDVEDPGAGCSRCCPCRRRVALPVRRRQTVDRPEEGGERLARPGRRDDERVPAAGDRIPGPHLRGGGRGERPAEPLTGGGGEPFEHVAHPSILLPPADTRPSARAAVLRPLAPRARPAPAPRPRIFHFLYSGLSAPPAPKSPE